MEVNRCLILDTETTGLDDSAQLIEIGVILYSVKNQCSLQEFSTLLPATSNDAEPINRIKVAALLEMVSVGEKTSVLLDFLNASDCVVAHNAEFDRGVLKRWSLFFDGDLPWLCTMADFKWPLATRGQGSLINLALEHGIGVASAHRALTDCRLIASLFDRMDGLQEMFQVAMRPRGLFQALVSYDDREQAKQAGFRWNGADRTWTRTMAIEDAAQLGFQVRRLEAV